MDSCSKIPLFAISLVLLSSLGFPLTVFRPETWGFSYSVLPCTCHDCTTFGTDGRGVEGEKEWRKQQGPVYPFLRPQFLHLERKFSLPQSLGPWACHRCRIAGELGRKKMKKRGKQTNKQTNKTPWVPLLFLSMRNPHACSLSWARRLLELSLFTSFQVQAYLSPRRYQG